MQNARERGWSWQEIAMFLGVSKQAVHKKYAAGPGPRSAAGAAAGRRELTMFEQFEPSAQQALSDARDEARRAGKDRIGSEHVLLGLLPSPARPRTR